jgi:RNA polymerase sigma factor (sigma-70 family)
VQSDISSVLARFPQENEQREPTVWEPLTQSQVHLIEENLNLIWFVLRRNETLWKQQLDEAEAFQEASFGLIRAVQKFDDAKGTLSTYAVYWIKQALRDAVRRTRQLSVPPHIWEGMNRLIRIQRELKKKSGKEPGIEETAEAMGCGPEKVHMLLEVKQRLDQHVLSLEQPLSEEDETWLGDLIAAPETDIQEREWMEQKELLSWLFSHLMPIEQQVMILRYHLQEDKLSEERKQDSYPRPYEVVGRLIGQTREFVSTRERRAFLKLRSALARRARKEREEAFDF